MNQPRKRASSRSSRGNRKINMAEASLESTNPVVEQKELGVKGRGSSAQRHNLTDIINKTTDETPPGSVQEIELSLLVDDKDNRHDNRIKLSTIRLLPPLAQAEEVLEWCKTVETADQFPDEKHVSLLQYYDHYIRVVLPAAFAAGVPEDVQNMGVTCKEVNGHVVFSLDKTLTNELVGLIDLARSIKDGFMIHFPTVVSHRKGFLLVAGELRSCAATLLGYKKIKVNVVAIDRLEQLKVRAVENAVRKAITFNQSAHTIFKVIASLKERQRDWKSPTLVATYSGVTKGTAFRYLRIFESAPESIDDIVKGLKSLNQVESEILNSMEQESPIPESEAVRKVYSDSFRSSYKVRKSPVLVQLVMCEGFIARLAAADRKNYRDDLKKINETLSNPEAGQEDVAKILRLLESLVNELSDKVAESEMRGELGGRLVYTGERLLEKLGR